MFLFLGEFIVFESIRKVQRLAVLLRNLIIIQSSLVGGIEVADVSGGTIGLRYLRSPLLGLFIPIE